MTPQRLSVKFFIQGDKPVDLSPFTPLFHRWIQDSAVEGLLIDVADYKHVPEGPGILLIGHDVDYGVDLAGGRPGLRVLRKRYPLSTTLPEILRDTLRKAVTAARKIAGESSAKLPLNAGRLEIEFIDRLRAPNNPQSYEEALRDAGAVFEELFEEGWSASQGSQDAQAVLRLVVTAKGPVNFDALHERLSGKPAGV